LPGCFIVCGPKGSDKEGKIAAVSASWLLAVDCWPTDSKLCQTNLQVNQTQCTNNLAAKPIEKRDKTAASGNLKINAMTESTV